jgi:hypothetical protein
VWRRAGQHFPAPRHPHDADPVGALTSISGDLRSTAVLDLGVGGRCARVTREGTQRAA